MSGLRLHFHGSGDAFGNGGRNQTCLRLEGPDGDVLIDCGATSLTALKQAGVEPNDVRTVLVTHLHGDHFGGLPFLVLDGQFRRRERDLVIAGPPGTEERVNAAMEALFPGSTGGRRRFETRFVELAHRTPEPVGPVRVTAFTVEQPGTPACALRVEYADRIVAYTGDTAWMEDLVALADGADLLVAEAYFFDREVPHHLDQERVRRERHRLACDEIILTHMSPDMLARQAETPFRCAHDGLVVPVGR